MDYDFGLYKFKEDKKNKKLIEKMVGIYKKLCEENDLPHDIIEEIPNVFVIPDNLTKPHKGFSESGKNYQKMKQISQEISKLSEV